MHTSVIASEQPRPLGGVLKAQVNVTGIEALRQTIELFLTTHLAAALYAREAVGFEENPYTGHIAVELNFDDSTATIVQFTFKLARAAFGAYNTTSALLEVGGRDAEWLYERFNLCQTGCTFYILVKNVAYDNKESDAHNIILPYLAYVFRGNFDETECVEAAHVLLQSAC